MEEDSNKASYGNMTSYAYQTEGIRNTGLVPSAVEVNQDSGHFLKRYNKLNQKLCSITDTNNMQGCSQWPL